MSMEYLHNALEKDCQTGVSEEAMADEGERIFFRLVSTNFGAVSLLFVGGRCLHSVESMPFDYQNSRSARSLGDR